MVTFQIENINLVTKDKGSLQNKINAQISGNFPTYRDHPPLDQKLLDL